MKVLHGVSTYLVIAFVPGYLFKDVCNSNEPWKVEVATPSGQRADLLLYQYYIKDNGSLGGKVR